MWGGSRTHSPLVSRALTLITHEKKLSEISNVKQQQNQNRNLCDKFCLGACVCVSVCITLASFSPGHHMQSWKPRLAPSVGLMPSPGPNPSSCPHTSLIIRGEIVQEHTHTHSRHTPTYVATGCHTRERRGVSHIGKVIRAWEDISEIHHA